MEELTEYSFSIRPDELSRKDLWFAMGYGTAQPDERIASYSEECIRELVPVATMRYMYRIVPACRVSPVRMKMDGVEFKPGGIICSYLDGMDRACLFVATAGYEFCERLRRINSGGDIFHAFVADAIGTVLAELALSRLELGFGTGKTLSMPYSPGYCGWDIREQHQLFSLLPPDPCGIRLSDSSLMLPEKSVSGFFALGEELVRQPYHCEICKNSKCYKRRKG